MHDKTFVFAATTCAKILFCYGYNIVMLSLFIRLTVKLNQIIAKICKNSLTELNCSAPSAPLTLWLSLKHAKQMHFWVKFSKQSG